VINSNLGPISHRFRNVTSFPLKTNIFTHPFNPKFENVPLALHSQKFWYAELIIHAKEFPYDLYNAEPQYIRYR